jgi:hypothetical protein
MVGRIIGLFISIGLIIGGLSGELVLRGTESSGMLVVVGAGLLIFDIISIIRYKTGGGKVIGLNIDSINLPAPCTVKIKYISGNKQPNPFIIVLNGQQIGEMVSDYTFTTTKTINLVSAVDPKRKKLRTDLCIFKLSPDNNEENIIEFHMKNENEAEFIIKNKKGITRFNAEDVISLSPEFISMCDNSAGLDSPATVVVSKNINDVNEVRVFNNGCYVATPTSGSSISFETEMSVNIVTMVTAVELDGVSTLVPGAALPLELVGGEEAHLLYENFKLTRKQVINQ